MKITVQLSRGEFGDSFYRNKDNTFSICSKFVENNIGPLFIGPVILPEKIKLIISDTPLRNVCCSLVVREEYESPAVMCNEVFYPIHRRLKEWLEKNEVGNLSSVYVGIKIVDSKK